MFLYADNTLSPFLDKLVNETTTPPTGNPNEAYSTESSDKPHQSINVTTL